MTPELLWLIAGFLLVIVELMTGTFYLLIFGLAAFLGAGAAWLGWPLLAQAMVVAAAAVAGSFWVRRRRLSLQGRGEDRPLDLGQTARFEAWVDETQRVARVHYRGAPWEADVAGEGAPNAGDLVHIVAVTGSRLTVSLRPGA